MAYPQSTPHPFSPARLLGGVCLLVATAFGQSDPLVAKSIPLLLADKGEPGRIWAFAADGSGYSRIDPFANPMGITSATLPFPAPVRGGAGRTSSLLLFLNQRRSDTLLLAALAPLGRDGKTAMDSLKFRAETKNSLNSGVEFSALALWRDSVVIGGGRAGFAIARLKPEGSGAIAADTLAFMALPQGRDTAVPVLRCGLGKECLVDSVAKLSPVHGEPDSVSALAVDSASADSVWLLVGTRSGLRRGLLGGKSFPRVALPGDSGGQGARIERLACDAKQGILWVFTASRYWFSEDHGETFRLPPDLPATTTKPSALRGFNATPQALVLGDSTFINFNLDRPGLIVFKQDTLLSNPGTDDKGDVILDAENGLDITRAQGVLTSLASARSGGITALAVGTSTKGILLRRFGPGQADTWENLNSTKGLKGSLDEIITYPTLFTGGPPGSPGEFTQIGYRLKKSGKVTITVYNYAMEKVRTVVNGAQRTGGGARSEAPSQDRWDGKDRSGRRVSVGTYYILVESNQGEKGWGKAMVIRGRN